MESLDEILSKYGITKDSNPTDRLCDHNVDSLDCYNIQGEIEVSYGIIMDEYDRIHPGRRIQEVRKLVESYL